MLGGAHAQARDPADLPLPFPQTQNGVAEAVHRVVVARPAVVCESAGLGRAARIGRRDAQRVERELDRAREAAVEIEEVDVGRAELRVRLRRARRRVDRGARRQVDPLRGAPAVVRARSAEERDPLRRRNAEPVRRALAHRDRRRALVHLHERVHELRIGEADPAVLRGDGADLLGAARLGEPREGIRRRHLRVARHQLRDEALVRLDRAPGLRAQRVLVQRVHVDRLAHAVAHLERVRERLHAREEAREAVTAWCPRELAVLGARAAPAVYALGAGDEGDLELAVGDPVREVVEEQDRALAPAGRLELLARRRARELGDPARQVVVRPGHRRDAADELRLGQELGPAGVGGGALERRRHQLRRLLGLPILRVEARPVPHLADPDDDCASV